MDIWQKDKLLLFLAFFIPGFISIKVYDLLVPSEKRDFSKSIFEVVGYSSLNYAFWSWLIFLMHTGGFYNDHKVWYFLFVVLIMFISPLIWAVLFFKLSSWSFVSKYIVHPIKKPWDYVFGKRESYWIIVHLKDGRKIGGRYDTNSFASSYPSDEQIYIEDLWVLDENGQFIKRVDDTKGVIVFGSEILSVEFKLTKGGGSSGRGEERGKEGKARQG